MASTNSNVATETKTEELSLPAPEAADENLLQEIIEPKEIIVADTVELCTQAVEDLQKKIHNYRILGMDCEWLSRKGRSPVALIQLATTDGTCVLIRASKFPKSLPDNLRDILQDDTIVKIGSSIRVDMANLWIDYKIRTSSCLDINAAAKSIGLPGGPLKKMTKNLLNIELDKNKSISCSNWEAATLSDEQKKYSALDALMPVKIVEKMMTDKVSRKLGKEEAWHIFSTTWPKEKYIQMEYLPKEEYRLVKEEKKRKEAEEYHLKPFVLVMGVPYRPKENLIDIIKIISEKLNVHLEPDDIKVARRLPWYTGIRGIFVHLSDYNKKRDLLTNAQTVELTTDLLDLNISPKKNIFVEDQLTNYMTKLYIKAQGLRKRGLVEFVWSEDGFVFIQKDDDSPAWKVTGERFLNERRRELQGSGTESEPTVHNGSVEQPETAEIITNTRRYRYSNRGNRGRYRSNFSRNQAYQHHSNASPNA